MNGKMRVERLDGAFRVLVLLLLSAFAAGCEPDGYEITEERIPLQVGDTFVSVVVHATNAPGLNGVNLHDDENTAVEAARAVMREQGGRLIELRHTGERNISFSLRDTVYTFDPNRIFTDEGAVATLADLGPYSDEAHQAVRAFARTLLEQVLLVDPGGVIVTLHNNTDEGYGLLSYTGGGAYAAEALFVHLASDEDADDFFFVTDRQLYDALREGGFNVVLQDNARASDDGSLSVYAGRHGIPYVNVEAQRGHFEEQREMIEFLNDLLFAGG